jgi:hypothetical protein
MSDGIDLHAEFFAATQALSLKHREWLQGKHGLDAKAIRQAGGLGIARIDRFKDGGYQPTGSSAVGEVAFLWPVWDAEISASGMVEGELLDLVAWNPSAPEVYARRRGDGVAFGSAAIARASSMPADDERGLPIYRSPLEWARAGGCDLTAPGAGAMILDWNVDSGLFYVPVIVAQDLPHGEDIEHRLKLLRWKLVPKMPGIRVVKDVESAAAKPKAKTG